MGTVPTYVSALCLAGLSLWLCSLPHPRSFHNHAVRALGFLGTNVRKTDINTIRLPQHRRLRHFNNGYGAPGKASLEHSPLPRS